MPANTRGRDTDPPTKNDALSNALEREKEVKGKEEPVKQHNPGDKGLNPGQLGPAQPSESKD